MRLIDADALIAEMHNIILEDGEDRRTFYEAIERQPTIEPKKGKWIEYDNSHCECPFCHEEWSYFDNEVERFNFCPNCGTKMEEGADG